MHNFTIQPNKYLYQSIRAFYHTVYTGHRKPDNPDYLYVLKNCSAKTSEAKLQCAVRQLNAVLEEDLPQVLRQVSHEALTVCVVPRSKAHFQVNQLLFRTTVRDVVTLLNNAVCSVMFYAVGYAAKRVKSR